MRTFEKLLEGSKWTICAIVTGIAIVLLGSITFGAGYYIGLMDCKGNRQGRRNRARTATEMDGTLHTDFRKSESSRDIKKYF